MAQVLGKSHSNEPDEQQEKSYASASSEQPEEVTDPKSSGDVVPTTTIQFIIILASIVLAIFCVALDNTIIVTAIPRITDAYKSLGDVGWYASAFILPSAALIPFFGRIYTLYSTKIVFLTGLLLFEIGSLISAVAPTSVVFIVGRAISGAGSAGVFNGGLVTIAMLTPLARRAAYNTLLNVSYAVATVTAPLIGGAFTEKVSWRWCFYINLPVGGVAAAMLIIFLHLPPPPRPKQSVTQILWSLDPIGQLLFLPSIICILLALQWAGTTYEWSSGRIIALLVLFGILLIAFIANELWMGSNATIPPKIASQRTVISASLFAFCNCAQSFLLVYFLPIYFQAIKNVDAEQSGIDLIPFIVSVNTAALLSGVLAAKFGTYVQYFYACVVLASIGSGLITTWQVDTSTGKWVGYQIISGFGTGLAFSLPQIAVQPGLTPQEIPIGIGLTIFFQFFGGSLWVSVGNNIVNTKLIKYIGDIDIPNFDARTIVNTGATELRKIVPEQYLPLVVEAYMEALRWTFRAGLIICCLSIFPALGLEWRSLKAPDNKEDSIEEAVDAPSTEVPKAYEDGSS